MKNKKKQGRQPHALDGSKFKSQGQRRVGCRSVCEPSRSSYQIILLIGPLALALALARRYNWSRAAL